MEDNEITIKCNDCKQPRKAIRKWNYKYKEFVFKLEYCLGCYKKQYINK